MYIWNLIITAQFCFPVNCIVLKVVENSYSMLYQHSNIIESRGGGGAGGDVLNWTILRKYEALLYYLFYISWYKNRFLYKEIYPISWYQNFIFGFKEIHFLISKNRFLISRNWIEFFNIKKSDLFFYIIDFFISRNRFFLNIKNRFLISRNTEWIVKRHFSAPFYYLFDIFF